MKQLFPYGKPVTGRDLVDRKEVIKRIITDVKGGQSVIIASPRRYGKSSVILECLKRVKGENTLIGYIDLFEKSSAQEFAEGIVETTLENETLNAKKILQMIKTNIQKFLKTTKFKYIWQEHEFVLSFGSSTADENTLLYEALDFPQQFAKSKRKKMVFAIDEFGELNNWGKELLKKMRAKFQRHDLVTYIFSGSQESLMKKLFTDKAQAFYGFGKIIPLGPLPQDDLAKYLLKTFNKGGVRISAETIQLICQLANNQPHYSKMLSQTILDQIGTRKEVKVNDVKGGYERALFQVKGELEREWENLSKASLQRRVLKFLALEKGSVYSKNSFPGIEKQQIYLALSELQAKGIIIKAGKGKFDFANPFFGKYILMLNEGKLSI